MATATAERQRNLPVPLADIDFIAEEIDSSKWYKVAFQLGQNRRWRGYGGGKWKRNPEGDDPHNGTQAYRHVPRVHSDVLVDGKTLAGLIASHNKWLKANRDRKDPEASIARMILVTGFKESDPPKPTGRSITPENMATILERAMSRGQEAAVTAATEAVTLALTDAMPDLGAAIASAMAKAGAGSGGSGGSPGGSGGSGTPKSGGK